MILKIAQFFRRIHREEKGFTLVELLVVMAILGVLAAIAIPLVANQIDAARQAANTANIRLLQGAADLFKLDTGVYPWTAGTNDWQLMLTAATPEALDLLAGSGTYFAVDSDWSGPYLREVVDPPAGQNAYVIAAAEPDFSGVPPTQVGNGKVDNALTTP